MYIVEDNIVKYNIHILLNISGMFDSQFYIKSLLIQKDRAILLIQEITSRTFPKKDGQFIWITGNVSGRALISLENLFCQQNGLTCW